MPSTTTTTTALHNHHPNNYHPLNPPPNHTKPMKQGIIIPPVHSPEPTHHQLDYPGRPWKPVLLRPHKRTNPLVWCAASVCVVFSLLLIIAGIITLIVFLVIKPRHPSFDTTGASLNSVYLDSPQFFNGDFTFLANFSNPNRKIDVMFEYVAIELYFYDKLIATQALEPFAQRRGEARLQMVHMVSSEVYLPPGLAMELQRQVRSDRVVYNIRGTFRIKASLGFGHYSYWLYGRCVLELTGPPSGVLVGRSCRTKR